MQDEIEKLIEQNIGLVYAKLNDFHLAKDPEAISIAYEALWKAIITYKADRNVKLSTYATVCIFNALGSYVRTLNKQRQLELVSYNNLVDENGTEFLDLFYASVNIEEDYIQEERLVVLYKLSDDVFNMFSNKHKEIVKRWIDSGYRATSIEIAKEVGCSQSYASQAINIFKGQFKKKLEGLNC